MERPLYWVPSFLECRNLITDNGRVLSNFITGVAWKSLHSNKSCFFEGGVEGAGVSGLWCYYIFTLKTDDKLL